VQVRRVQEQRAAATAVGGVVAAAHLLKTEKKEQNCSAG
jgi:hypothetical protein